nr:PAAR domain-containing protein [uncultured Gilliamella sp.]
MISLKGIIRLSDSTDHGGTVITASSTMTVLGKPVAGRVIYIIPTKYKNLLLN